MDNKKAAQLLISLYASYRAGNRESGEYEEAVALAIMALGKDSTRLTEAQGSITRDWGPFDSDTRITAK